MERVSAWWDVTGAPKATRSRKRRGAPTTKVKASAVRMAKGTVAAFLARTVFLGFGALEAGFGVVGMALGVVGVVEVLVRTR